MPTGADLARELCEKFPDTPTLTLARKLYDANKERFASLDSARSTVRTVRGNMGANRTKGQATHPRPKGRAGWVPECPPSLAEAWEPFLLPKPARVLSLSDAHIPYHDPKALESAVNYGRKVFKPDVVLLLGDFADFYAISRWEKDPKKRNFVKELGIVEDCLRWLRGAFPKALIVYKEGNHEERYTHYIWNKAPELWDVPACRIENILHLADMGIEMVTDKRIVMIGELPGIHGHEPPQGLTNPVNQARGAFLRMLHSTLSAHGHRSSTHTEPNLFRKETTCFSQGCLCDLSPLYLPINKWDQSFATIEVAKNGEYDCQIRRLSKEYKVRAS